MRTMDVKRETVTCRLLDGKLTDDDRDFIRANVTALGKNSLHVRIKVSDRMLELLQLPNRQAA